MKLQLTANEVAVYATSFTISDEDHVIFSTTLLTFYFLILTLIINRKD